MAPGGGRVVVIGVGHRDRGDDAIGPAVADEIGRRLEHVTAIAREGDLAVLPLLWTENDDVVVVDACWSKEPAGHVHEIDPDRLRNGLGMSTHGLSVADAVTLAEKLGRRPASLTILGVDGHSFAHGPMSRELAAAFPQVVDEVIRHLPGCPDTAVGGPDAT